MMDSLVQLRAVMRIFNCRSLGISKAINQKPGFIFKGFNLCFHCVKSTVYFFAKFLVYLFSPTIP